MCQLLTKIRLFLFYRILRTLGIRIQGGHFFHFSLLKQPGVVIDAGANIGKFSSSLVDLGKKVVAIEPVPEYAKLLYEIDGIIVVNGALTVETRLYSFYKSEELEGSSLTTPVSGLSGNCSEMISVQGFTLKEVMFLNGLERISLLKLDIEGEELNVLDNLSDDALVAIPQIIVEFHDFLWPEQLPRIKFSIERLNKLGFISIRASRNYFMDMVFLNKTYLKPTNLWVFNYSLFKFVSWR